MKLKSNHQSLIYKNDKYEVFNVKTHDHLVDTLILACSEDEDFEPLLIPVDKAILVDNIPYFTAMFREDSNWIEGKAIENLIESEKNSSTVESAAVQESEPSNSNTCNINWINDKISKSKKPDGSHYLTLKMTFPHKIKPLFFAKFIKSLYIEWMDIHDVNCIDYYRVIDYLQDENTMNRITNFIKKHITFDNSIELLRLTSKFDQSIENFYNEKDVNDQEMTSLINYVEDVTDDTCEPAIFIKVLQNIRKKSSSSVCVDIIKVYLSNIGRSLIDELGTYKMIYDASQW